jgi:hypothetical protein
MLYHLNPLNQRPGHTHTHTSLLQIKYPAVSTVLTKDFKYIEAQMEVDIVDANEGNLAFISNLHERIIVQENHLAKSENITKKRVISLLIIPTSGKQYMAKW